MKSPETRRREARSVMAGEIGAVAALLVLWAMVTLGTTASNRPPIVPDPQLTPGATLEVTATDATSPTASVLARLASDPPCGPAR